MFVATVFLLLACFSPSPATVNEVASTPLDVRPGCDIWLRETFCSRGRNKVALRHRDKRKASTVQQAELQCFLGRHMSAPCIPQLVLAWRNPVSSGPPASSPKPTALVFLRKSCPSVSVHLVDQTLFEQHLFATVCEARRKGQHLRRSLIGKTTTSTAI